ncbi:hypothetical protein BH23CHL2_BH23CHL2_02360 [soil metagenome]
MIRLIDIAGRTGQAPVRSLFSLAVGSDDDHVLQPHEIRYRNDQHHVLYGLYDDDLLLGVIGLARDPAADTVEIRHLAVTGGEGEFERVRQMIEHVLSRQRQRTASWQTPESLREIAEEIGFRFSDCRQGSEIGILQLLR